MATTNARSSSNQTTTGFQAQFDVFKKWSNMIVLPLGLLLIGLTWYHFTWTLFMVTVVVLTAGLLPNFLWFVPTGYIGVLTINGDQLKKSFKASLWPSWKIPFISSTDILEIREQSISLKDSKKKTNTRNKLEDFEGIFTYTLNQKEAHWLVSRFGLDYEEKFLAKWVDAAIDTVVGKLVYAHFQGKKPEVEDWMTKIIQYTIALEMSNNTASITGGSFDTMAYSLEPVKKIVPNPDKDPTNPADAAKADYVEVFEFEDIIVNAEKGETERVVKLELVETPVTLPGVNPFEKIGLRINTIVFEKRYEDGKAGVKAAEAEVERTRLEAEATLVKAEATAKAKKRLGEGDAEAARLLMESLNGDADAAARILAAREMKNLQGTLVQGGGAGVMVSPNPKP